MRRLLVALVLIVTAAAGPARAAELDLVAPADGPIIRHFEPPPTPFAAGHRGIDLRAPAGSTVVAAAAGLVAFAGPVGGTHAVSIDHPTGHRTTYSFLSAVTVEAGRAVDQGSEIGRSGQGHAGVEPLLHFGLRREGEYLDPEPVLLASMRANLHRVIRLTA